jgi:integrase
MSYTDPDGLGNIERTSTGKRTKGEAQAVLTARIAEIRAGQGVKVDNALRVSDLYDLVLADYDAKGNKSTPDLEQRWRDHLQPFFGQTRARAVDSDMVDRYVAKRRQAHASKALINRELAILRRAFKLGVQKKKVPYVPHFSLFDESNNVRKGTLTPEQYRALDSVIASHTEAPFLLPFFRLAAQRGTRRGELIKLRVSEVFLDDNVVTFRDTKNGEDRTVPIPADCRDLLKAMCAGKNADDAVFTWPDGSAVSDFRDLWAKVTTEAGVPGLLVHDLRRAGATLLINAGLSEKEAMSITGHKTRATFDRYHIVNKERIRDLGNRIDQHTLNAQ